MRGNPTHVVNREIRAGLGLANWENPECDFVGNTEVEINKLRLDDLRRVLLHLKGSGVVDVDTKYLGNKKKKEVQQMLHDVIQNAVDNVKSGKVMGSMEKPSGKQKDSTVSQHHQGPFSGVSSSSSAGNNTITIANSSSSSSSSSNSSGNNNNNNNNNNNSDRKNNGSNSHHSIKSNSSSNTANGFHNPTVQPTLPRQSLPFQLHPPSQLPSSQPLTHSARAATHPFFHPQGSQGTVGSAALPSVPSSVPSSVPPKPTSPPLTTLQIRINAVLSNPSKRGIFHELRNQPGITLEELLQELEDTDVEAQCADDILMKIISRREEEEESYSSSSDFDQEQENRDIDRAIMISEGEREVIAARKRCRRQELLGDCSVALASAPEYQQSTLLSSTEACHDPSGMSLRRLAEWLYCVSCSQEARHEEPKTVATSTSSTLGGLSSHPSAASSSSSTNSHQQRSFNCKCLEHISCLRMALAKLLWSECEARKFHGEFVKPYFQQLTGRLKQAVNDSDNVVECMYVGPNGSIGLYDESDRPLQTDSQFQLPDSVNSKRRKFEEASSAGLSMSECRRLQSCIDHEVNQLETALYLSQDSLSLPSLFRVAYDQLQCSSGRSQYSLEEDGLEIV